MFIKINNIVCNLNSIGISDSGYLYVGTVMMDITKNQYDILLSMMARINLCEGKISLGTVSIMQKNLIEANCNISIVGLN